MKRKKLNHDQLQLLCKEIGPWWHFFAAGMKFGSWSRAIEYANKVCDAENSIVEPQYAWSKPYTAWADDLNLEIRIDYFSRSGNPYRLTEDKSNGGFVFEYPESSTLCKRIEEL